MKTLGKFSILFLAVMFFLGGCLTDKDAQRKADKEIEQARLKAKKDIEEEEARLHEEVERSRQRREKELSDERRRNEELLRADKEKRQKNLADIFKQGQEQKIRILREIQEKLKKSLEEYERGQKGRAEVDKKIKIYDKIINLVNEISHLRNTPPADRHAAENILNQVMERCRKVNDLIEETKLHIELFDLAKEEERLREALFQRFADAE